jgi:hypothetical protein
MARAIAYISPSISKDIMQLNLSWRMEYQGLHSSITMGRVIVLYRKGLRYFHDILDPGRNEFLKWEVFQNEILLVDIYHDF